MTGEELREIIERMELTQVAYADLMGVTGMAVRRWLTDKQETNRSIPKPVARYTRLLLANPDLLQQAWEIAGLPDGRKAKPRGRPKKTCDS
jgi:DNA-binding transcriptional regulator YiaG